MERLTRALLKSGFRRPEDVIPGSLEEYPERILQFGEGNFLRAFVDWMVNALNRQGLFNGRIVVVQPITQGLIDALNEQEGLYTLYLRGLQDGMTIEQKEIITSISRGINPYTQWAEYLNCARQPELRYIVSNTTEAGIAFVNEPFPEGGCPQSFPAKVAVFLFERFKCFGGDPAKGMIIIPCELINHNGSELKRAILHHCQEWSLGREFREWLETSCTFLNTLVDRIVTGYPRDEIDKITHELGYEDRLVDTGEYFHLWVIEGPKAVSEELPFHKIGMNVIWTDDLQPYRERKVRFLNGAHTMTVPAAFLFGLNTVKECVEDQTISSYMHRGLFEEVLPVVPLPDDEKRDFAKAVFERFSNPFIKHMLLSIALNSVSKFKVRVLPSLLDYHRQTGSLPAILSFSLAALIAFYRATRQEEKKHQDTECPGTKVKTGALAGNRAGQPYEIRDDAPVLDFFAAVWQEYENDRDITALTAKVLSNSDFWEQDLSAVPGLEDTVAGHLQVILQHGMAFAVSSLIEK